MKVSSITIPRWFDRHLHIRDGEMMRSVLPSTINQRATGAVIMPNLADPISTIEKAKAYRDRIRVFLDGSDFVPCMTLYLTDHIDPEEVVRGFEGGVWGAVKLYMANQKGQGGTTGSTHGVKNLLGRYPVFGAMEKHNIPLLAHFEAVEEDVDEFDREIVSVDRDLKPIHKSFPGLPVVFEHLTDGRAADFVAEADCNIYATVTAHHLMINRNAMFWGGMNPVNYCKPVPKREEHRLRVRKYVTSGDRRFGAGTDSAPHDESVKSRCYGCAAGIFTAPTAVEMYTMVFDEDSALERLGPFLSENFIGIYGMEVSSEKMTIESKALIVPEKVGGVQVFKGGTELPWRLAD
ncbi:MAG: dihydroorotase [Candidatus Staskawiczbacteria bacterium]|nr:dihydroorotase [Candidatus Staskawiczbacteria bacterium]